MPMPMLKVLNISRSGHVALLLDEVKDGQHRHVALLDLGGHALGQAAGDVFIETAAGDVGDGLDRDLLHEGQDALDIDAGGGQQRLTQGLAAQGLHGGLQIRVLHVQDLADQREAVGVHAGGGQAEDHIAGLDLGLVKDLVLIHHAHGEAGQVILVDGIEARHLGGLAADEGSARLDAALGHTGDDARDLLRDVLAAGDVVQEEQGLGAARR